MIFLHHIPKTGGSAIFRLLADHYGNEACLNAGPYELPNTNELDLTGKKVARAHCDFTSWESDRRIIDPVVILRDPITRVWSHWLHAQKAYPWDGLAAHGFEAWVALTANEMTRRIAGEFEFVALDVGEKQWRKTLQRARDNLKRYSEVGRTEDLDHLVWRLNQRFGLLLKAPGYTPSRWKVAPTDAEDDLILRHNEMDLELYQYVVRHYG